MEKMRFKPEPCVTLAIAIASSALCGNKFGIAIAQFVFLIFAMRSVLKSPARTGWLVLLVPCTVVLTIADWGIVPGDSIFLAALPWLLTMLVTSLSMLVHKLVTKKWNGFTGTLVFPCVYTVLSFIYATTNVFGTWDQIAYKLIGYEDIRQIVSVTGLWGVSFLAAWTASIINWLWENKFDFKRTKTGMAVFLSIVFVVIVFGQVRLNTGDTYSKTVKVAGITINSDD